MNSLCIYSYTSIVLKEFGAIIPVSIETSIPEKRNYSKNKKEERDSFTHEVTRAYNFKQKKRERVHL